VDPELGLRKRPRGVEGVSISRLLPLEKGAPDAFSYFPNRFSSTTSLTTGEPAEKSYIEWFLEGKNRSLGPILSLFGSNTRYIQLHFLLI
jgi:hypothetical protein